MKILEQKSTVTFDLNLKKLTWWKAKDMIGKTIKVDALGVNEKSKFGAQAFMVSGGLGINLPSHCIEEVREILKDVESVDAIKTGMITATFEEYETKSGNKTVVVMYKLLTPTSSTEPTF